MKFVDSITEIYASVTIKGKFCQFDWVNFLTDEMSILMNCIYKHSVFVDVLMNLHHAIIFIFTLRTIKKVTAVL